MPRSVLVTDAGHAHVEGRNEDVAPVKDVAPVLDDLADALRAYDRLARLRLGDAGARPLVVTRAPARGEAARAGEADALVLGSDDSEGGGDAIVLGVNVVGELEEALGALAADHEIGHGRPVYLVFVGEATAGGAAEAACDGAGLVWAGGLVVPGWSLVPGLLRHPRMGILRRPLSEATDDLVAAIRSGLTVKEAARTFAWPARELVSDRDDLVTVRDSAASRLLAALARRHAAGPS